MQQSNIVALFIVVFMTIISYVLSKGEPEKPQLSQEDRIRFELDIREFMIDLLIDKVRVSMKRLKNKFTHSTMERQGMYMLIYKHAESLDLLPLSIPDPDAILAAAEDF